MGRGPLHCRIIHIEQQLRARSGSFLTRTALRVLLFGLVVLYAAHRAVHVLFSSVEHSYHAVHFNKEKGEYSDSFHKHVQYQKKARLFSATSLVIPVVASIAVFSILQVVNPDYSGVAPALAATQTYTVSNTNAVGAGSLWEAVKQANAAHASNPSDTYKVVVSASGTVTATTTITVTAPLLIEVSDPGTFTYDGDDSVGSIGILFAAGSDGAILKGMALSDWDVAVSLQEDNITVGRSEMTSSGSGVEIEGTSGHSISENTMTEVVYGVNTESSSENNNSITVNGNTIGSESSTGTSGIALWSGTGGSITDNTITNFEHAAIDLSNTDSTGITGNTFASFKEQGIDVGTGSNDITIGKKGEPNYFISSSTHGVFIQPSTERLTIQYNVFGTDASGTSGLSLPTAISSGGPGESLGDDIALTIQNNYFSRLSGDVIYLNEGGSGQTITNNFFGINPDGSGGSLESHGVYISGNTTGFTISGNSFANSTDKGIAVIGASGGVISGNTFLETGAIGVYLDGAPDVNVTDNYFGTSEKGEEGSGGDGILLKNEDDVGSWDSTISGNTMANLEGFGIWFEDKIDGVTVSGNTISSVGEIGIGIDSGTRNIIMSGNTLLGSGGVGIEITSGQNITISDNKIGMASGSVRESYSKTGISVKEGSDISITGNQLYTDSGKPQIELQGVKTDRVVMSNNFYEGFGEKKSESYNAVHELSDGANDSVTPPTITAGGDSGYSGNASSGATVEIYKDGSFVDSVIAGSDGKWSTTKTIGAHPYDGADSSGAVGAFQTTSAGSSTFSDTFYDAVSDQDSEEAEKDNGKDTVVEADFSYLTDRSIRLFTVDNQTVIPGEKVFVEEGKTKLSLHNANPAHEVRLKVRQQDLKTKKKVTVTKTDTFKAVPSDGVVEQSFENGLQFDYTVLGKARTKDKEQKSAEKNIANIGVSAESTPLLTTFDKDFLVHTQFRRIDFNGSGSRVRIFDRAYNFLTECTGAPCRVPFEAPGYAQYIVKYDKGQGTPADERELYLSQPVYNNDFNLDYRLYDTTRITGSNTVTVRGIGPLGADVRAEAWIGGVKTDLAFSGDISYSGSVSLAHVAYGDHKMVVKFIDKKSGDERVIDRQDFAFKKWPAPAEPLIQEYYKTYYPSSTALTLTVNGGRGNRLHVFKDGVLYQSSVFEDIGDPEIGQTTISLDRSQLGTETYTMYVEDRFALRTKNYTISYNVVPRPPVTDDEDEDEDDGDASDPVVDDQDLGLDTDETDSVVDDQDLGLDTDETDSIVDDQDLGLDNNEGDNIVDDADPGLDPVVDDQDLGLDTDETDSIVDDQDLGLDNNEGDNIVDDADPGLDPVVDDQDLGLDNDDTDSIVDDQDLGLNENEYGLDERPSWLPEGIDPNSPTAQAIAALLADLPDSTRIIIDDEVWEEIDSSLGVLEAGDGERITVAQMLLSNLAKTVQVVPIVLQTDAVTGTVVSRGPATRLEDGNALLEVTDLRGLQPSIFTSAIESLITTAEIMYTGETVTDVLVMLEVHSDPYVHITRADEEGRWTLTVPVEYLDDGVHTAYLAAEYRGVRTDTIEVSQVVVVKKPRLSNTTWAFLVSVVGSILLLMLVIAQQMKNHAKEAAKQIPHTGEEPEVIHSLEEQIDGAVHRLALHGNRPTEDKVKDSSKELPPE